jgi:iron-sulfur cluster assembly accessory protein
LRLQAIESVDENITAIRSRRISARNACGELLNGAGQGGGCSGFSYGFTFDEVQAEDDFDFVAEDVKVLVDAMSMQYLQGSDIDYREDAMGASFVINNPQAASTCGCGSSFSV